MMGVSEKASYPSMSPPVFTARLPFKKTDNHEKVDTSLIIAKKVIDLLPVSRWIFIRFKGDGDVEKVYPSISDKNDLCMLRKQFMRQREKHLSGPSIATAYVPFHEHEHMVSMVFANRKNVFGHLVLFRDQDMGPFSSSELRLLTFALDAASDRFTEHHLMEAQSNCLSGRFLESKCERSTSVSVAEETSAYYVLNRNLEIVLSWNGENHRRFLNKNISDGAPKRLPHIIEDTVRKLTGEWMDDPATQHCGLGRPVPFLSVHTRPMSGEQGLFIGVLIERVIPSHSLMDAAMRFNISPREMQVLVFLLRGEHIENIAGLLHITSSTVQDHIKSLLRRTDTQNRSEMIAKILGWNAIMPLF